jgi:hypothetical protein
MDYHKPYEFVSRCLRNKRKRISLFGKGPHRCSIETKLRRKASHIQPKHCLKIRSSIIAKRNLTTHATPEPILAQQPATGAGRIAGNSHAATSWSNTQKNTPRWRFQRGALLAMPA